MKIIDRTINIDDLKSVYWPTMPLYKTGLLYTKIIPGIDITKDKIQKKIMFFNFVIFKMLINKYGKKIT